MPLSVRPLWALALSLAVVPVWAQAPAGAAAAAPDPKLIRLGLILPLTGGSSDMGNSARVGAQVAVDEINAVGGYLGRKLELVIRDDQANNDMGLAHAE
ncbi:MAG: ABC transporter substrate-binding protein, partial [Hydrogenophaga sp.]|nr:ABC transporter substrate-binding protein [Hydrogenophaga sp.]